MESHLTHCDVEKCETELLGALDRPEEKGEWGDSTTGVPEHWLPPRSRGIRPSKLRSGANLGIASTDMLGPEVARCSMWRDLCAIRCK